MAWNHKLYGTIADPIRQSDLGRLASAHSCPKRFAYEKNEQTDGARERTNAPWKACIGTATHETLRRAFTNTPDLILAGRVASIESVLNVLNTEIERAADGLPIDWRGESPQNELIEAAHMVRGAIREVGKRAKRIVLVEAPFYLQIERNGKTYHVIGTLDCAYETHDGKLVLIDWKTGDQIMIQVVLDHGYQFGVYAEALARALFFPHQAALDRFLLLHRTEETAAAYVPGTCEERIVGRYPDEIYVGHLKDFVPYKKAGSKKPTRVEQLEHFKINPGSTVKYVAGDERGPGWYRARRTEADRARLIHSVHTIVGTVRLGRFVEHIDEGCGFCPHRARCLTDGHAPMGEEKKALDAALADVEFDGFGDEAA